MNLEKQVEDWIKSTLSTQNEIFGNMSPCPYARKAWTDKKVKVLEDTFTYDYDKLLSGELDVILVVLKEATFETLMDEKKSLTKNLPKGLVILEDHPEAIEEVKGFNLNFGKLFFFLKYSIAPKLNPSSGVCGGIYKLGKCFFNFVFQTILSATPPVKQILSCGLQCFLNISTRTSPAFS